MEAIVIHTIWILTSIITAMPFLITWRNWQEKSIQGRGELLCSEQVEAELIKTRLLVLGDINPITNWNVLASGITVVASLAAPVIQALIK